LLRSRSPANGAVDHLADEVGMAVVARVLLDHVDIDPAQRDLSPTPEPGVVEREAGRVPTAAHALLLPHRHVMLPVGVIEWDQLAVLHGGIKEQRLGVRKRSSTLVNQLRSTSAMWRTNPCSDSNEVATGRATRPAIRWRPAHDPRHRGPPLRDAGPVVPATGVRPGPPGPGRPRGRPRAAHAVVPLDELRGLLLHPRSTSTPATPPCPGWSPGLNVRVGRGWLGWLGC
jgi:hypothetical protein